MIDLMQSTTASPRLHLLPSDPGKRWTKDAAVAIEAPPDDDLRPLPEARWPSQAQRTGVCGAVTPRVLALPGGGFRMYYTQILPRPGFPAGANDYENATTRILSAVSSDGATWTPEPGVRLSPEEGGAGEFRVVSAEVVTTSDGWLRMYYECCQGSQSIQNTILSAISNDGLAWRREPGVRFELAGRNLAAPRIVYFPDGTCRLYCLDRGRGIISARSDDGGETFHLEPGLRIAQGDRFDAVGAFAPDIALIEGHGYVMHYAGYAAPNRAYILRADSDDGLNWRKQAEPVLAPGGGKWDAAKCSEMCLLRLPGGAEGRFVYRLLYEACDGTATNERGVWRIASATSLA